MVASSSTPTHISKTGQKTVKKINTKKVSLTDIPVELLTKIFILAKEPRLIKVSRAFMGISRDPLTIAKFLWNFYSFNGKRGSETLTLAADEVAVAGVGVVSVGGEGASLEEETVNLVALVQDNLYDTQVAIKLLSLVNLRKLLEITVEWSAANGDEVLLQHLVSHGLPLELKGRSLIQSSLLGFPPNVKILLDANTDPNFDNNTSLCMASKYGHLECIIPLLEAGANIHAEDDYSLCWASRLGHFAVVQYLLQKGANIAARRNCALQWAAEGNHLRIVKLLLNHGADIHSNDDHSLRWASVHGHYDVVELLLKLGANVHSANDYALRNSVKMRHLEIIKLLLENGADIKASDDESIKWAVQHNDSEVLAILKVHCQGISTGSIEL